MSSWQERVSWTRDAVLERESAPELVCKVLESEQRAAMQGGRKSYQQVKKSRALCLVVEGYSLPMYWMHLQVAVETTLATLDHFLRDTWLECCGHLSVFRIGGLNYYVDADQDAYWWDMRRKNMQVKLEEVLSPGQTCSYEYDFGSTTELLVKVVSEYEVEMKGKDIPILARNSLPIVPCDVCRELATGLCTQCIYEDKGCLCDACARSHECGKEMLLPLVNSPRAGVCGYTGQDPAYSW